MLRMPGTQVPNGLRDDCAVVSQLVIEEPSRSVEEVDGVRSVLHGRAGNEKGHSLGCDVKLKMVLL